MHTPLSPSVRGWQVPERNSDRRQRVSQQCRKMLHTRCLASSAFTYLSFRARRSKTRSDGSCRRLSGDITALDWVGRSSEFHSCLPADISSYKTPPHALPSLSEDDIQTLISRLQNAVDVDMALKLYSLLDNLGAPHFTNRGLRLPCIAFLVTEFRRSRAQDQEAHFAHQVKASGLRDLLITTQDKLTQFSRTKSTLQTVLLVRPWDLHLLELPDFADNPQAIDNWSVRESTFQDTLSIFSSETVPIDSQSHSRALRLIVRLGQPFSAFLLARQHSGEYKRIASDCNIIAQVREVSGSVHKMKIRTLEIS